MAIFHSLSSYAIFTRLLISPPSNRASRISSCAVMLIGGWYSSTKKIPKNRKQNVKWGKKHGWRMKTFRQDRWPEVSRLVGRYSPLFFFAADISRYEKIVFSTRFFLLSFSLFAFPLCRFLMRPAERVNGARTSKIERTGEFSHWFVGISLDIVLRSKFSPLCAFDHSILFLFRLSLLRFCYRRTVARRILRG